MSNVPDDWGNYYYSCGCHASEGGCSCPGSQMESAERPWLEESGYELEEDMIWFKLISSKVHTCRRTHQDGRVQAGQRYRVKTYRYIQDDDGSSWLRKARFILR